MSLESFGGSAVSGIRHPSLVSPHYKDNLGLSPCTKVPFGKLSPSEEAVEPGAAHTPAADWPPWTRTFHTQVGTDSAPMGPRALWGPVEQETQHPTRIELGDGPSKKLKAAALGARELQDNTERRFVKLKHHQTNQKRS